MDPTLLRPPSAERSQAAGRGVREVAVPLSALLLSIVLSVALMVALSGLVQRLG